MILSLSMGCSLSVRSSLDPYHVPKAWRAEEGLKGRFRVVGPSQLRRWWEVFDDQGLSQLIERALEGNPSVKEALSRVARVRAEKRAELSRTWPRVSLSWSGRRDMSEGGSSSAFGTEVEISWEVDALARLSDRLKAQRAEIEVAEEEVHEAKALLAAEVAENYFEVLAAMQRQKLLEGLLERAEERARLLEVLFGQGLRDRFELERAYLEIEALRRQIHEAKKEVEEAEDRLCVLLGKPPGTLRLTEPKGLPSVPSEVLLLLPVDAIRTRPDVRRAERQVLLAQASLGLSKLDRLPSLSLTGALGLHGPRLVDLVSRPTRLAELAAYFGLVLFQGGGLKYEEEAKRAGLQEAKARYEGVVLSALKEVEGCLLEVSSKAEALSSLEGSMERMTSLKDMSMARFRAGLGDYLEVLDAEAELGSLKVQWLQTRLEYLKAVVKLYKALGGGWWDE